MNGRLPTYEFDRSAVVLSSIGARCGKCFLAEGRWSSLANTQVILPDADRADPRFLWYQLNDETRWPRSGTAQPFIKPSDVKAHRVFLPPLAEQRRIAAILDQADALRAKRRDALAQIDEMAFAEFAALHTRPENATAPEVALEDVVDRVTVGHVGPTSAFFREQGVPFLRTGNVGDGEIIDNEMAFIAPELDQRLGKSKLQEGDVLISRVISDAVRCGIVPRKLHGANCANVIIVRPGSRIRAEYLSYLIRSSEGQEALLRRQVGSAQSVVNTKVLGSWRFRPPRLDRQDRFREVIRGVEVLRTTMRRSLKTLDEAFSGLQHRAFRGEL